MNDSKRSTEAKVNDIVRVTVLPIPFGSDGEEPLSYVGSVVEVNNTIFVVRIIMCNKPTMIGKMRPCYHADCNDYEVFELLYRAEI